MGAEDEQQWQPAWWGLDPARGRARKLFTLLKEADPPGIVYVPTRRAAEDLAQRLSDAGYRAQAHHGGMSAGFRRHRHEDFAAGRGADHGRVVQTQGLLTLGPNRR
ncbi:hypothetical protein [Micromonospora globbae]|uniref:hypothetical protein n=1 Tax=Micromonospora globbae TaxID=1894969 RepID=UPI003420B47B